MKRITATLAVAALLMSACQEREHPLMATSATPTADPVPMAPALPGALTCSVDMKTRTVSCPDAATPAAAGMMANAAGERVIGGQGLYVRLASFNVDYDGATFTFDATVQNLTTQAMATDDGITPHGDGVMVFVPSAPEVTGGSGTITVNGDAAGAFTGSDQPYYRYGGTAGAQLGVDGLLAPGETSTTRTWSFTVPATVTSFTFGAFIATQSADGPLTTVAPQITSFSASELVPGSSVTITGYNFHATPVSNTVLVGGVAATVTGGNTASLTVTVPCRAAGATSVQVSHSGLAGVPVSTSIDMTPTSLAIGEPVLVNSSGGLYCTELAAAGGTAEYIVSVFSASTSPSSNAPFTLSGAAPGAAAGPMVTQRETAVRGEIVRPALSGSMAQELDEQAVRDARHHEMLELNIRLNEELRARFPRSALAGATTASTVEPPLTRKFRIFANNSCAQYYVVSATRVYYDGKVAIYEDDATPADFKSSLNATMASNYLRIGDQFNADMEPIIRTYFGDPLLRDAQTDNNGVLVALFTPHINTHLAGFAGFVISCDQYPNDDDVTDPAVGGPYVTTGGANGASNFGEVFYAYQPVVTGTGYSDNTAENWYRTIRSTFIHETKHVASQAARVANGASFENAWLEEGTARHSEELWGRTAVDNLTWKANNGYGSASSPGNIWCDVRPTFAECIGNPRRPANVMNRHFSSLNTHLAFTNARLLSPFGPTSNDTQSYWYAISWSLVRYAVDRYATTEQAFFTALNDATTTGAANLATVAGVSIEQLLAEWNLALAVDDYPDLVGADPSTQLATWNLRDIYAGYRTDFPSTYTLDFPQVPAAFPFGSFTGTTITTLRGGGALWYRLHGTQTASQLLQLRGNSGAALPADVRMAIVRVK